MDSDILELGVPGYLAAWYGETLLWKHPRCDSWFPVEFGPGRHDLVSRDLLTIRGELVCPKDCGTRGLIDHGEWRSR